MTRPQRAREDAPSRARLDLTVPPEDPGGLDLIGLGYRLRAVADWRPEEATTAFATARRAGGPASPGAVAVTDRAAHAARLGRQEEVSCHHARVEPHLPKPARARATLGLNVA